MTGRSRYWRNETGVCHHLRNVEETGNDRFPFRIQTECGLDYQTQTAGFTWDPDKPDFENSTYPEHSRRCNNCSWPEDE